MRWKKRMRMEVGHKNAWSTSDKIGMVLPISGRQEDAVVPAQEWWIVITLEFNQSTGGGFSSCSSFLLTTSMVCQRRPFTLPCLKVDSMIWWEISRRKLLLHSPDWVFTLSGSPSGPLAQASVSVFPVKLILEQVHDKINNVTLILHHLAGLFSLYQRATSRGHLRPCSAIPSSFLPSPAPYISDLISYETQSKGLRCYPITTSRFIRPWEAWQGFMICMAPFLSFNLFVTFILRNFLSFLTPLHLFLTVQ